MAERTCRECGRTFDGRGPGVYCEPCLPRPSRVGAAAYQRRRRALSTRVQDPEYSRSYARALRALARKYPYEFALLLADERTAAKEGS